jgi:hypothetical protein
MMYVRKRERKHEPKRKHAQLIQQVERVHSRCDRAEVRRRSLRAAAPTVQGELVTAAERHLCQVRAHQQDVRRPAAARGQPTERVQVAFGTVETVLGLHGPVAAMARAVAGGQTGDTTRG